MRVICDTSFLMVLCYKPIKNIDALESRFGKAVFLIHQDVLKELAKIKHLGGVKRSKIANLTLEVIENQVARENFKYIFDIPDKNNMENDENGLGNVDSRLLSLAIRNRYPLATIDKNLISRALRKGADIITLKNNKAIFVKSYSSDQI
ncbi:MAG: hypothetical protein M3162_05170 [Thermoproteota archaeon]|nr:hypothetical protein [Thermoproteota archaeon]